MQVANRLVSKYQNSYLALRLRGTTQKKCILESQCPFFSFTPFSLEAQYEFNNNIWKRPSIEGFWYFTRSRSRETHKYMQNTTKFARNLIKYNIFETYFGYWGCLIAVNLQIYLETSSPQWANNVPKTTRRKLCCEKLGTSHDVKSFAIRSFFEHFVDKIATDHFC